MAKKNKLAEYQKLRSIIEWQIQGQSILDIRQTIMSMWSLSLAQANRMIRDAAVLMKSGAIKSTDQNIAIAIESRMAILREVEKSTTMKMDKKIDFKLKILQDVAKLQGLYQEKIDLTTNQETIKITMVIDEGANIIK